jgi:hypothetical protein
MDARSGAIRWLASALTAVCLIGSADAVSAQFKISRFTIDGGGGTRSAAGAFALGGTLGQPDAGRLTSLSFTLNGGFWFGGSLVSAVEEDLPGGGAGPPSTPGPPFRVYSATPNPVTQRTVIAFDLPEPTLVRAALYDVSGRLLRILVDEPLPAGAHWSAWDRRDQSGRLVVPGIYFLRLDAGIHRSNQRIVVVH